MIETPLPGGLLLRTAGPADLDQIAALLVDRGEPADAHDHRLVVTDPDAGWDCCAVVVDGDRVVSTLTLLDEQVRVRAGDIAVTLPAGQIELVATDRAYEGRGLVRALIDWAHRRGAQRGQLVQVLLGIPYFYRQFGYGYAIPIPATRALAVAPPPAAPGDLVRPATAADVAALVALQDAAQAGAEVAMAHPGPRWRWLLAREGSSQWVVERAGTVVGAARVTPPDEGVRVAELAAVDVAAAYALLGAAAREAGGDPAEVRVTGRPGTVAGDAVAGLLTTEPTAPESYYLRVPDPVALFEALRPVLGARLVAGGFADAQGELVLSFFRSHLRFDYDHGTVGPVRAGGPLQAPGVVGGAGVAPDLVAHLLFGPLGFAGLADRHPDVYASQSARPLFAALFPPVHADLLSYYLP